MNGRSLSGAWVVCGLLALSSALPATALAASGGDANAGDVWVDTAGAPAGPGHEMDPHLPCANIDLWGAKLADSGGGFTIDGWPPSGARSQAYSGSWSYDTAGGGSQVIAVIDVNTLIAGAAANGDAPHNAQGYHFKLQLSQDPRKSKTFWVDCAPPAATTQPSSGGSSDSGGDTPSTPSSTSATGTGTAGGVQSTALSSRPATGLGLAQRRHTRARSHRRVRHHRRHRPHRRHRTVRRAVLPAFTG